MTTDDDDVEDTRPDIKFPPSASVRAAARAHRGVSEYPIPEDMHEAFGQIMGEVARMRTAVADLVPLRGEVAQLRRDIEKDRSSLVKDASRDAAHGTGNRMAALLGALGVLYELASPYLQELIRWVHR